MQGKPARRLQTIQATNPTSTIKETREAKRGNTDRTMYPKTNTKKKRSEMGTKTKHKVKQPPKPSSQHAGPSKYRKTSALKEGETPLSRRVALKHDITTPKNSDLGNNTTPANPRTAINKGGEVSNLNTTTATEREDQKKTNNLANTVITAMKEAKDLETLFDAMNEAQKKARNLITTTVRKRTQVTLPTPGTRTTTRQSTWPTSIKP